MFEQPGNPIAVSTALSLLLFTMELPKFPRVSPYEEYDVGHTLTLNILPEQTSLKLRVQVRQLQKPRTLSCGMVVDILDGCDQGGIQPTTAFLKLFDRRFADQLREREGIDPWTKDMEESYIKFVQSGRVHKFLHDLHHVKDFQEETEDDWDDAENEAFLADKLLKLYTTETATYNALRNYQGCVIPRLSAEINLDLTPPNANGEDSQPEELFRVKGILLQYIDGFCLSDLADRAPQSSWQNIVDQAISIVHVLGDNNIMNEDVRHGNFMVSPEDSGGYRVFMIDFGLCIFRGQDESDRDWGRKKITEDEEGAIGLVMKMRLERHGFELNFKQSDRYFEWAGGQEEEDDDSFRKYRYVLPGVVIYSREPLPHLEDGGEHEPQSEGGEEEESQSEDSEEEESQSEDSEECESQSEDGEEHKHQLEYGGEHEHQLEDGGEHDPELGEGEENKPQLEAGKENEAQLKEGKKHEHQLEDDGEHKHQLEEREPQLEEGGKNELQLKEGEEHEHQLEDGGEHETQLDEGGEHEPCAKPI